MKINPFDILSGKVVQNHYGTFWFKEAGVNIDKDGNPITENLHRENNLPAAMWIYGDMWWYVNGVQHRLDGPAMINSYQEKWYFAGQLHNATGPAIAGPGNAKEWYSCGVLHRIGGPARIQESGTKSWYNNGVAHRLDGPAIEMAEGNEFWFICGVQLTEQQFNDIIKCTVY